MKTIAFPSLFLVFDAKGEKKIYFSYYIFPPVVI
jgi:hypothetical protein